jgi:adenosylcobinamide-phosphate synthase
VTPIESTAFILAVALAIDRLVGDPAWVWRRFPHPIAMIGRAIDWLDRRLNDLRLDFATRRRRGLFALVFLSVTVGALGWALDLTLSSFFLGWAVETIVVAILLAHKALLDHVTAVELGLSFGGLSAGRAAAAEIVGRDVSGLDESGVSRAAIESAAENFSDGVVAPAFWYLLLGLPGLLVYKTVNTADSMIGHRSPRYAAFGWAAARLDDLMNFVPARLSALLIAATAALAGCDARAVLLTARRDAPKHASPNAGWPEAALAGALGLALGGPRRYGDEDVDGAWLNRSGRRDAAPDDIRAAVRLIDASWALFLVLTALAAVTLLSLAR